MSSISQHARAYADALDILERIRVFRKNEFTKRPISVRLSWNEGSAVSGYEECRKSVEKMIEPMIPDLLARAEEEAHTLVQCGTGNWSTQLSWAIVDK